MVFFYVLFLTYMLLLSKKQFGIVEAKQGAKEAHRLL